MFVCLLLFIFTGELPLVENRHKLCVGHPFFLSFVLQLKAKTMSHVRGKGGKLLGEGRGAGMDDRQGGKVSVGGRGVGLVEGARDDTVWLARDIRETGRGGNGSGQVRGQGGARPRRRFDCTNCQDTCCGLARELVRVAFKMGRVTMSPKVMAFFVSIISLIYICRSSIKECLKVSELSKLREGGIVRVQCPLGDLR